ncbi:MAG: hypothetical protein ACRCS9_07275, partial [Hyphomicrobium sp.]
EFALRSTVTDDPRAGAPMTAGHSARRYGNQAPGQKSTAWAPWETPFGAPPTSRAEPRKQARRAPQGKPKSIFDLLFN